MSAEREYLIEFSPNGNAVKVSAVDVESGIEVSIVGPANADERLLSQVAIRKLEYVLAEKSPAKKSGKPAARRRGILA